MLRQIQQVSGSTDDPLERSEWIHYHSEIIKAAASA